MAADVAAMVADFGGMRVFLARHVPGFLEQRHVDHARGVALRARVAIPVPGAAEITAFLDDAIVCDPGFFQPRAHDQPGKPTADKGEGHRIGDRVALLARGVRIRGKIGEPAFEPDILRGAIGAQALVAFLGIFAPQRLRIDRRSGPCLSHVPLPRCASLDSQPFDHVARRVSLQVHRPVGKCARDIASPSRQASLRSSPHERGAVLTTLTMRGAFRTASRGMPGSQHRSAGMDWERHKW